MCKVAGATKITDQNRDKVWLFMITLGDLISQYNDDGLGYAAFDKDSKIFGEKWLINNQSFRSDVTLNKYTYANFGEVKRNEATGIIFHTRAGTTGGINIQNTHPFINDVDNITSAIIHNGMISNHMQLQKKYSTCDSEVLVHLYDQLKVSDNFQNVKQLMNSVSGWLTVLGLSLDGTGRMIMDMFSDGNRLGSFYIPELETRVFSTQLEDIKKVAEALGMSVKDPLLVKANTGHRLDVLTGEIIESMQYVADDVPEQNIFRKMYLEKFKRI